MQRIAYKKTKNEVDIHILAQQDYAYMYTAVLAIWTFIGIVCVYLLTIIVNSYILTPIAFILWLTVFCILLFLASWHLSGVEIIKLTASSLDISREINAFSYKKSFTITKCSNFVVPTTNEKLFLNSFKISTCNKSIYPGNVAFEYENNHYSFGYQISHNEAVEIATTLNNFVKSLS